MSQWKPCPTRQRRFEDGIWKNVETDPRFKNASWRRAHKTYKTEDGYRCSCGKTWPSDQNHP